MATRSKTTYNKRQKEFARTEKQREKAAKRSQRKLAKPAPDADQAPSDENIVTDPLEGGEVLTPHPPPTIPD